MGEKFNILCSEKASNTYVFPSLKVYNEVERCCSALSERLDRQDFFFGNR